MRELPVIDAADQQFGVILNNRRVTIRLRYNVTTDRWSFDLSIDDLPVIHGRRIVTGVDLLAPFNLDIGSLFALATVAGDMPGRDALPSRLVRLYHATAAELAEIEEMLAAEAARATLAPIVVDEAAPPPNAPPSSTLFGAGLPAGILLNAEPVGLALDFKRNSGLIRAPGLNKGGVVSNILTATRASVATYFDANGIMRTAAANELRFDHDPVTKMAKGALGEGIATSNLLKWSEDFGNAVWTRDDCTVQSNVALAPDGTMTADKMSVTVGGGVNTGWIQQTVGVPAAAGVYTGSVFMEKGSNTKSIVAVLTGAGAFKQQFAYVTWNGDGTIASVAGGSYWPVGGGRYRVSTTLNTTADNTIVALRVYASEVSPPTAGDGPHVWGGQINTGSVPTSYVKTTSAAATRAVDLIGLANGGLWGNELTVAMEFSFPDLPTASWPGLFRFTDTVNPANKFGCWFDHVSRKINLLVRVNGVDWTGITAAPVLAAGQTVKLAARFADANFGISVNGSAPLTTAKAGALFATGRLDLLNYDSAPPAAHAREFIVVPRPVTNSELQAMAA